MAKKKAQPGTPQSLTKTFKKLSEAKKQVETFFNSIPDDVHFTVEVFSTADGIQVSVGTHGSK